VNRDARRLNRICLAARPQVDSPAKARGYGGLPRKARTGRCIRYRRTIVCRSSYNTHPRHTLVHAGVCAARLVVQQAQERAETARVAFEEHVGRHDC
jgi:hypothetical protein